jgi:Raf kinase inhibitor-like YbhB/YbcL family protein
MAQLHSSRESSRPRTQRRQGSELNLTSSEFEDDERIPRRFTADGENVSPPLEWGEPPLNTRSFALVCEDPDAPSGLFVHWILWNIPPTSRSLDEAVPPAGNVYGVLQGKNGFGRTGYGGPKPPPGSLHRYVFRLIALDGMLDLPEGAEWRAFGHAIEGRVLGTAILTGLYGR